MKGKPKSVAAARISGDTFTLRKLGRRGAEARKKKLQRKREETLRRQLEGAREAALEANEHICPVD